MILKFRMGRAPITARICIITVGEWRIRYDRFNRVYRDQFGAWTIVAAGFEYPSDVIHLWQPEKPLRLDKPGSRTLKGQIMTDTAFNDLLNRVDLLEKVSIETAHALTLFSKAFLSLKKSAFNKGVEL